MNDSIRNCNEQSKIWIEIIKKQIEIYELQKEKIINDDSIKDKNKEIKRLECKIDRCLKKIEQEIEIINNNN